MKEKLYKSKNFKNQGKLIEYLTKKLSRHKNKANIIVSGGYSLKNLYERLSLLKTTNFYLSDERLVSSNSKLSNFKKLNKYLGDKLLWPTKNLLSSKPYKILRRSNSEINLNPKKCIAVISIGEDGHICSIFNNFKKSLKRKKNFYLVRRKNEKFYRITLSLNFMKNCNYIFFVLIGKNKINITNKIFNTKLDMPIRHINKKNFIILTAL